MMKKLVIFAVLAGVLSLASFAKADVTLVDANATAVFDLTNGAGMYNWTVDGVDHLFRQWFYYQIDGSTVASLETLGTLQYGVFDLDLSGENETLSTVYTGNTLQVKAKYILAGSEPGGMRSDVAESISLKNTGAEQIVVDFYQYVDLDLNGTPIDSSVFIDPTPNTANQLDAGGAVNETFVIPSVDVTSYHAGFFNTVFADVMNGGGLINDDGPHGPGDLAWAFHWQYVLDPGDIVTISKDKTLVPVPGAALLGMIGLGLVGWARRRYS